MNDILGRAVGQALVAATLAPGETLADPIPHAIVSTVVRLREDRDRLAAELAAYKRAKAENDERYMLERDDARAEVERLRAELAEALATLANERGEGEPPEEGWVWRGSYWVSGLHKVQLMRGNNGWHVEDLWFDWRGPPAEPSYPTARAAMRAASAAAKGGEK